jgi:hypothetical protein
MRTKVNLLVAAMMVGLFGSASAQRVSLTPDIGLYVPTAQLINLASGGTTGVLEQKVSLSVGGKLDVWFTERFGVQGTGTYAPSQLSAGFGGLGASTDANLFMGSGRLTYYVLPRTSLISFQVNGGVGWLKRSGQAYADVDDTSDITGTLGAAVGLRLGPLFSVRVSGESYLYKPDFVAASLTDVATQNDFNLSIGVGVPLLGLGSSSGN